MLASPAAIHKHTHTQRGTHTHTRIGFDVITNINKQICYTKRSFFKNRYNFVI